MTPSRNASQTIDLNCDVGEAAGRDHLLVPLVSSVNIACGGHAGDTASMLATLELARAHGVAIGGHPGHRDREHFGRRQLPISGDDAARLVCDQLAELAALTPSPLDHVKLHGGLYHQVAYDLSLAEAVCAELARSWTGLRLVLPAGAPAIAVAAEHGLRVSREAFLDRAYTSDGTLVPRGEPGGVLTDASDVAERAVRLVREDRLVARSGRDLRLTSDTLCIHGDGPTAVDMLQAVRRAFTEAGIGIRPHAGSP
jgi:UPF0271 protein